MKLKIPGSLVNGYLSRKQVGMHDGNREYKYANPFTVLLPTDCRRAVVHKFVGCNGDELLPGWSISYRTHDGYLVLGNILIEDKAHCIDTARMIDEQYREALPHSQGPFIPQKHRELLRKYLADVSGLVPIPLGCESQIYDPAIRQTILSSHIIWACDKSRMVLRERRRKGLPVCRNCNEAWCQGKENR